MSKNILNASDLKVTATNTQSVIISKLKSLEGTGQVLSLIYSSTDAKPFDTLSYIIYRDAVNYIYSDFITPNSLSTAVPTNNIYGVKQFFYITIDVPQYYELKTYYSGGSIKIYINNYLAIGEKIYLSKGIYLFYIEKFHSVPTEEAFRVTTSYKSLSVLLTPFITKDVTVNIDKYISTKYTPLLNANTSRDNSINAFCASDVNLFTTGNVCDTSLKATDLLDNNLNNYCFPSGVALLNPTTNKLNDNCKNTYNRTDLNSTIKTNFKSNYKTWANKTVTDNQINNNFDPLLEYINSENPNEVDFPFHNNFKITCETNLKNVAYDVTTQSNNDLCKKVYNRTYTGANRTNVDNSIQQIKNNWCDPNQTLLNLNSTECTTEYKTKDNLSNAFGSYCFPNGILKKGTDKLYDNDCKTIHNLPDLNSIIKTNLDTKYSTWVSNQMASITPDFANDDLAINQYIIDKKPTQNELLRTGATTQIIDYCSAKIGDQFTAPSDETMLCNSLYSSTTYNNDPKIQTSINKIKTDYCTKVVDGKPRYETDSNCKSEYTNLLKQQIQDRCIVGNNFQYNDSWCNALSDNNISSNIEPYLIMSNKRNDMLKNEVSNIEVKDYADKKFLSDNNYKYATNKYKSSSSKNLSDQLLNNKLFDYCENKEPNYPTDPNSQCKGIYDTFATSTDIMTSRDKIRDSLCQQDVNILTDTNDDKTNNTYKCKSTVFNTGANLDKFLPKINTYCASGNNITSTECQTYYTDIETKILDSFNLKINESSKFSNKNSDLNDYDNKIIISGFENDNDQVESNYDVECKTEIVEYQSSNSYDILSFFLLFILIILFAGLFSSCMFSSNKKKENKNK